MEIMLAIAIMGIGMAMAAALFPAAVKENEISYDDTVGNLICENGLAVAKSIFTADTSADKITEIYSNSLILLADESFEPAVALPDHVGTAVLSEISQHHPQGRDDIDTDFGPNEKPKGFVVLGRKDGASYQLVIVSYSRKRRNPTPDDYPTVEAIDTAPVIDNATVPGKTRLDLSSDAGDRKFFKIGGTVISNTGSMAKVVSFSDDNDPVIEPQLLASTTTVWTTAQITVKSTPGNRDTWTVGENPVMSVLVMRTGLPE